MASQRSAMRVFAACVSGLSVVVLLFPPFVDISAFGARVNGYGYHFLFSPPLLNGHSSARAVVDVSLLLVEYLVLGILAGAAWLMFLRRSPGPHSRTD